MVVLHLLKVHKRMRNVHNSALERTAANLIANPQVQNFHDLKHVSNEQLRRIAVSVIHDCCEDQGRGSPSQREAKGKGGGRASCPRDQNAALAAHC
jgi:hypothetical protein